MPNLTLMLGGRPQPDLAARVARGEHPRVDYLEFLKTYAADVESFDGNPRIPGIDPYWILAARIRSGRRGSALATGEDVGLPAALIQAATGGKRPLSIIVHGSYFGSKKARLVFRALRRQPWLRFLCLSESLRRHLVEAYEISSAQVFNAGYGVDTQFFAPASRPQEGPLVAAAGMANRDYRTLTAAAADLGTPTWIAADSAWFRSRLDIDGLALPPQITVQSCGDYRGLRGLYARASVVVVPLYEAAHACGYAVIAEAMAMGRPVIATRTKNPSDYVIEGETGFLVPPGDVPALRARIQQLLAEPDLAARMGENARRHIERHFTVEAYNRRIARALGLLPNTECSGNCDDLHGNQQLAA